MNFIKTLSLMLFPFLHCGISNAAEIAAFRQALVDFQMESLNRQSKDMRKSELFNYIHQQRLKDAHDMVVMGKIRKGMKWRFPELNLKLSFVRN